jgi:uncharacterized membrane protein YcaP (DUF421 family)
MDIALRAVVLYLFIVGVLRVSGRRELSSLAPTDVVLLIVLGDAIQQGLVQDDYSVTGAMIAISSIMLLQVAISYLAFRWRRFANVVEGDPIVVLQDGRLIERNLRRERLTAADVAEEARGQGIGSLSEVRWAVLEPSGSISFIK